MEDCQLDKRFSFLVCIDSIVSNIPWTVQRAKNYRKVLNLSLKVISLGGRIAFFNVGLVQDLSCSKSYSNYDLAAKNQQI